MSYQEEQIADIAGKFRSGRITRREFLHHVSMLGGFTIAAGAIPGILASCAPTQAPTPAVSGGAPKRGGTLVAATIDNEKPGLLVRFQAPRGVWRQIDLFECEVRI